MPYLGAFRHHSNIDRRFHLQFEVRTLYFLLLLIYHPIMESTYRVQHLEDIISSTGQQTHAVKVRALSVHLPQRDSPVVRGPSLMFSSFQSSGILILLLYFSSTKFPLVLVQHFYARVKLMGVHSGFYFNLCTRVPTILMGAQLSLDTLGLVCSCTLVCMPLFFPILDLCLCFILVLPIIFTFLNQSAYNAYWVPFLLVFILHSTPTFESVTANIQRRG